MLAYTMYTHVFSMRISDVTKKELVKIGGSIVLLGASIIFYSPRY